MNLDFHYYATYTAARLAGFEFDEAQKIAHAAQYVDESDRSLLTGENGTFIENFEPVPTVQSIEDMSYSDIAGWSTTDALYTHRIWIPFHFLPGNYDDTSVAYSGPRDSGSLTATWQFTAESEAQFRLLCRPQSRLVADMINDLCDQRKPTTLEAIGLRIHVLCDTWAHCNYAGIPAWFLNDVHKTVIELRPDGTSAEMSWIYGDLPTDVYNLHSAAPPSPWFNSLAYLGHARMGHVPDFGYIKYKYTPRWSSEPLIKDNQEAFRSAFLQMVHALKSIKDGSRFDVRTMAKLNSETEQIIKDILATPQPNQADAWKANLVKIMINNKPLELPSEFSREAWLSDYLQANRAGHDSSLTSYYRFNLAAYEHLAFVRTWLESRGIDILSESNTPSTNAYLRANNNLYFSHERKEDYQLSYQFYPHVGSIPILLNFIKVEAGPHLCSGDIVEIKTSENSVRGFAYLGAWSTKALYYFSRDSEPNKQRWKIEKLDGSIGTKINPGDAVYIINQNWTSKPYMAAYIDTIFQDGVNGMRFYLTTVAEPTSWTIHDRPQKHEVWPGLLADTMLLASDGTYLVCSNAGNGQFSATQGRSPFMLSIPRANGDLPYKELRHGDSIFISTPELVISDRHYLGSSPSHDVSFDSAFQSNRDRTWIIEKLDLTHGMTVRDNDAVTLRNPSLGSNGYLSWREIGNGFRVDYATYKSKWYIQQK